MGGRKSKALPDPGTMASTEDALIAYYESKVKPLEVRHLYKDFYSPPLDAAELTAKPSVLILGQYSVGKTSMISYLLNEEYPGSHIGPEPTTDVFVIVQHGSAPTSVPGPALLADKNFPFRGLSSFGGDFLGKLRGATMTSPLLKGLTFIDTPGILSGEKQRTARGYDYHKVIKFLAEKVDRIWVLFDTSKMDISDEFKLVLNCLAGNDEKLRIILNKADAVKADELVRVRGALMWNLGKILMTPEVPQVIIGSFWEKELTRNELREAFLSDYRALMKDLRELPTNAPIRKINDVVKRARKAEVHALLMDELLRRRRCLGLCGADASIARWTKASKMKIIYAELETREKVSPYDFPNVEEFANATVKSVHTKWMRIRPKDRELIRTFLEIDVGNILEANKARRPPDIQEDAITAPPKNLAGGTPGSKEDPVLDCSPAVPVPSAKDRTATKASAQRKASPYNNDKTPYDNAPAPEADPRSDDPTAVQYLEKKEESAEKDAGPSNAPSKPAESLPKFTPLDAPED